MELGTLLFIEWSDAGTINRWEELEDLLKELHEGDAESFYTVGFLVRQTKKKISVVQTVNYSGSKVLLRATDSMDIPMGCVHKITILKSPLKGGTKCANKKERPKKRKKNGVKSKKPNANKDQRRRPNKKLVMG